MLKQSVILVALCFYSTYAYNIKILTREANLTVPDHNSTDKPTQPCANLTFNSTHPFELPFNLQLFFDGSHEAWCPHIFQQHGLNISAFFDQNLMHEIAVLFAKHNLHQFVYYNNETQLLSVNITKLLHSPDFLRYAIQLLKEFGYLNILYPSNTGGKNDGGKQNNDHKDHDGQFQQDGKNNHDEFDQKDDNGLGNIVIVINQNLENGEGDVSIRRPYHPRGGQSGNEWQYHKQYDNQNFPRHPEPAPVHSAPVNSAPVHPAPVNSAPVHPAPVNSAPVHPAPVNSAPVHSVPAKSVPAANPIPSNKQPAANNNQGNSFINFWKKFF